MREEEKKPITLRVKHQGSASLNTPYFFSVEVVGYLTVARTYPEERVQMLVRTNGPSMLYGATREIIRDLTARGPHPAVYLPGVSFYENQTPAPIPQAPTAK